MIEIPLTQGKVALVDDEDAERVLRYKWHADKACSGPWYASSRARRDDGRRIHILMHRLILNAPKGKEVDHVNGNSLDNRKENLRLATRRQNGSNRRGWSGYKGVRRRVRGWEARIGVNSKQIHLGTFDTAEEAARAYDNAAKQYFGEFAQLNFKMGDGSYCKSKG